MGTTSEDGYGIDFLGNGDGTDPYDISSFHLFVHRKWRRSKLLARRISYPSCPSTRDQPQHIRVLARIVRAHHLTRCTILIANRRSAYFSRDLRNGIGIAALLAREGVGGISEEKRELGEENGNMRDILDLKHKKTLRLGVLLLSTLIILSASALAYSRVVYERALNVGSVGGVATGSGSTTSAGVTLSPATVLILAVLVFVIGLSITVLLAKVSRRIGKTSDGPETSPTDPVSTSPGGEEWEESATKDEGEG